MILDESLNVDGELLRFFPPPSAECPGIHCLAWGSKTETDLCGPRTIAYFAASLILSGRGFFESEQRTRTVVRPGSLFFVFPGERHRYGPQRRWEERWVLFDGPYVRWLLRERLLDPREPLVSLPDTREAEAVFDALGATPTFARATPIIAAAHVHAILRIALASREAHAGQVTDRLVERARRILDAPTSIVPSIDVLAARLRVSPSTLRRRFAARIGLSPKQYVLRRRIARAQELLIATDGKVADIAFECGFDDPFYFSRQFRKIVGCAPEAFRTRHRGAGAKRGRAPRGRLPARNP